MSDDTSLCYLDAAAIMFLVDAGEYPERTTAVTEVFEAAERGEIRLVTSMISVAEVAYADFEKKQKLLDPAIEKKIDKLWHPASPIRLIEVHETIIRKARSILRHAASKGVSMGGANDMIHVASALREDAEYLFTYDKDIKKWNSHEGLIVCEPNTNMAKITKKPTDETDLLNGLSDAQVEEK